MSIRVLKNSESKHASAGARGFQDRLFTATAGARGFEELLFPAAACSRGVPGSGGLGA